MAPLLQVENLTIGFPRAEPVRNLSFEVGAGETLAIVGESGSGKSLTALALMQLLPRTARATSGSIVFCGRDLLDLDAREMRQLRGRDIAMVFQEPMTSLNPVMSIGRQIGEVLKVHEKVSSRAARERAIELLKLVRIPAAEKRVDDYPHQLSGGMRQRVMIAMAVACRPKLLIADEPTTALDVTIQAQVLDLLDSLRRELQMAVVLITHDLGVVAQWADKVVVMYAGRKVEQALPGDLFNDPLHPYTRGLLSASPRLKNDFHYLNGPLTEIPGTIVSAAGEAGCPFRPRCRQARASCAHQVPPLIAQTPDRLVACPFTSSLKAFPDAAHLSL
ncbi:ATP-binding cassette domain-containing protein [Sinorhizobium meliloti]|uniref:ATP-binding cassette domain-containing protein n=1 Tax=Rhizobium meliloti TaxID=382 RepID=A0A6A8A2I9_RHIML|nr:ABC transporter ATP-binding protein [Sinorhizobium meliloti]MDW9856706.1 ATP-binding cassette domain-containing protein [Sinorhizobium meliloti]MDW9875267.1 ATP-binding cassette domain-containing protein [Sinorhizobium meliloti]MDW9887467.1 ATP-binding cassette domain-containing protein [Sinorhizobium meliloti]MDW9912435.1 ATP-binding cassette domain-containing protein [Sinorhizobium meliloti]MDW9973642.1 ATP-binding cassette domain-containing protein [Sinorhizobium meliloti]